jgi:type I restriction-modification system DNA methylase subunit
MSGVDRQTERVKATGEVFTPTDLVIDMCQSLMDSDPDTFAPGKTVIDPACGDGQFLVVAKWIKILNHAMSEEDALNDIYGVDIMRDNVDLCRRRLGGGNIVMGDTLNPSERLTEQTEEEHNLMREWFTKEVNLEDYFI